MLELETVFLKAREIGDKITNADYKEMAKERLGQVGQKVRNAAEEARDEVSRIHTVQILSEIN